ncbi:MAG: outer membrane protein assembly factor BamA [Verrucomicrobiota bacterium]
MFKLYRVILSLALLTAWVTGMNYAHAQMGPKVLKIEVRILEPANTSESLIRTHIRIKESDEFNQINVDDDIRNLYGIGFFQKIQVNYDYKPEGVILTYVIEGKPRVTEVKLTGNKKYSDSKLLKKITTKVGDPLDHRKLFNDKQELLKHYEKSGYHQTKIEVKTYSEEGSGRARVTFEINESPKIRIQQVEFDGAHAFKTSKLKKEVKTKRRWFFSWLTGSGRLKDDVLDEDKEKLTEFYQNAGYIDFDLKEAKAYPTGPKTVVVKFTYEEGRQYKVGSITFTNNTVFPTTELASVLKMKEGNIFNPKTLNEDVEALKDKCGTKGYIEAVVVPIKRPNVEKGTMDMIYLLEEGKQFRIEKVEIRGNNKTKDKVIRRELAVVPGEIFDMVRVKTSKKRLEGLSYFEKVDTAPEPSDSGVEDRRNLVVSVDEKATAHFTLGAGFSSVTSLEGYVEFTQGNFDLFNPPRFTGGGQKLRLHATVGLLRQDYQVSFIEPWFMERKLQLGIDLYHRALNYVSRQGYYDERRTGFKLSLQRALGSDYLIGSVYYNLERVGLVNVSDQAPSIIKDEVKYGEYRVVSKLGGTLAYDTRDHNLNPTKGHRSVLLGEFAGLGGDTKYYRLELRHAQYIKGLFEGHLLELSAQAGAIAPYGDSPKDQKVPLFDRYFLGGLSTLRGFNFRDIGPHEPQQGEPIGGQTFWFGSAEYYIPIVDRLKFALFYDIGNAYEQPWSLHTTSSSRQQVFYNTQGGRRIAYLRNWGDQAAFYDNWGLGLRLDSPLGPLRFDFGFPIHSDQYTGGNMKFQFSVGWVRDF